MKEDRVEIEEEDIFEGTYGESITLTVNDIDEEGNQIFKIIPADTIYVKINNGEGSIILCSTSDLDGEEDVIAEIKMPSKVFEDFISDVEDFIHARKTKQTRIDQFVDKIED